jgi:hypothetical protein
MVEDPGSGAGDWWKLGVRWGMGITTIAVISSMSNTLDDALETRNASEKMKERELAKRGVRKRVRRWNELLAPNADMLGGLLRADAGDEPEDREWEYTYDEDYQIERAAIRSSAETR